MVSWSCFKAPITVAADDIFKDKNVLIFHVHYFPSSQFTQNVKANFLYKKQKNLKRMPSALRVNKGLELYNCKEVYNFQDIGTSYLVWAFLLLLQDTQFGWLGWLLLQCASPNISSRYKQQFTVYTCILCLISCKPSQPRRGGSNQYPQSMFWAEIRKIMYTPVNRSFII